MRSDEVRSLLRKQPFQPFRLHLSNGKAFDIRHPELAMVGRSTVFIGRPAKGFTEPTYEDFDLVDLLHINNVEPLPSPTPPVSN